MIVVLSGEGSSDLGQCNNAQGECQIPEFAIGPMTLLVDKIIDEKFEYSVLEFFSSWYVFISKAHICNIAKSRPRKSLSLPGKNNTVETKFFFLNAWALGVETRRLEEKYTDTAIAVLFRDGDGTNNIPRNEWNIKVQSAINGFDASELGARGVPMIPRPKSEAWLLCAAKPSPYQHCAALEDLSGNDNSPNSAKIKLDTALQGKSSTAEQVEWIQTNNFDHTAVAKQMPSFSEFKERLLAAVNLVI